MRIATVDEFEETKRRAAQRRGEESGEEMWKGGFVCAFLPSPNCRVVGCVRACLARVTWLRFNARGEPTASLQMNRLRLRNNRSKVKTAGELPIILEESMEYASK